MLSGQLTSLIGGYCVCNWAGSGVTRRSLEAVKDVWAWSDVPKGLEIGMFPFDRLADRRYMDYHGKRYKAAMKIQVMELIHAAIQAHQANEMVRANGWFL